MGESLYYGGTILPMTGKDHRAEALLVRDGRIAFVGSLRQARERCGKAADAIDLRGRALLPAFIDPHGHLPLAAQFLAFADLSGCTCLDEIVQVLRRYREERQIGPGGVIVGVNYDDNFLAEHTHPDRMLLDQVSRDVPVFAYHISSHMGAANSRLLELSGYSAATPDPAGGRLGRRADGALDGYVEEVSALAPVLEQVFGRAGLDLPLQMDAAQEEYLRYGVTTVQDGAGGPENMRLLAGLADAGRLKLDVVSYVIAEEDVERQIAGYAAHDGRYQGHYKIGGYKVVLDGSPQGRTAWLSRPYEGGGQGYPYKKDEELYRICRQAIANRRQLLAHCNGDAASEQFLTQYTCAWEESPGRPMLRPVMIHCQTVRGDQLERMKRLGMIPSFFVGHTYFWGDVHLKNLGPERGAHISPVRSALEKGLVYNLHQDTPVTKPDMLHTVWCAVNRRTRSGAAIGPEQRIGVYDALRGVTCNAAYAYGEEAVKGTLEPGKLADLVVLDRSPLETAPEALRQLRVEATVKEGVCQYGSL